MPAAPCFLRRRLCGLGWSGRSRRARGGDLISVPSLRPKSVDAVPKARNRHLTRGANQGWKRRFDEPIPLPRGRQLVTLEDAGNYITKLAKAEHEAQKWQAAMEALILVAEHNGATMMARIGIMRALNRHHVRDFSPDRKDHHWGKRKLARDR